jgi:hypothetical protein
MKISIEIPDALGALVQAYLKENPDLTLERLVQEGLEASIKRRSSGLLALAGFVSSNEPRERTEQEMRDDERERPEDEVVKRRLERQ